MYLNSYQVKTASKKEKTCVISGISCLRSFPVKILRLRVPTQDGKIMHRYGLC